MPKLITVEEASEVKGHRLFTYATEASTIGLAPGEWPDLLETTLGNGRPFIFLRIEHGDVRVYRQELGCLNLQVFND